MINKSFDSEEGISSLLEGPAAPKAAPKAEPKAEPKSDPDAWKSGYDTLAKQMGAIQSKTDIYKRKSPLDADKHIENIARSLAKDYGVTNLSDIGTRTVTKYTEPKPLFGGIGDSEWGTPGEYTQPEPYEEQEYFSKTSGKKIPHHKFASEGSGKGYSNYNLQAMPDGQGGTIVMPVQQYSKSGMGEVMEDLAPVMPMVNLILMTAGVPPILSAAGNVALQGAAGEIKDIGDVMKIAAPHLIAGGLQELVSGTNLLTDLAGADFSPLASTPAGMIVEAAGIPASIADTVGKYAMTAAKAGVTGEDIGTALKQQGIASLMDQGKGFLSKAAGSVGDFIGDGIKGALPDLGDRIKNAFSIDDLVGNEALQDVADTMEGDASADFDEPEGIASIDTSKDFGNDESDGITSIDQTVDLNAPLELPPGAEPDQGKVESFAGNDVSVNLDEQNPEGIASIDTSKDFGDDSYDQSNPEGIASIDQTIDLNAPLELPPGAEPDEAPQESSLLNPAEYYDPEAPLGVPPEAEADEPKAPSTLEEPAYVHDALELPPGAAPDEEPAKSTLPEPPVTVPSVFPPIPLVVGDLLTKGLKDRVSKELADKLKKQPEPKKSFDLSPVVSTLLGGAAIKGIFDSQEKAEAPKVEEKKPDYKFNWNNQAIKGPVNGAAYGQRYFGPSYSEIPVMAADGGLMSLDNGGIQSSDLYAGGGMIAALKRGGLPADATMIAKAQYLASKGEPEDHIVEFLKHHHKKDSHPLGSYSDGGHLLKGPGDGMSDDIPATIANARPARLANEEFVIPADVVSHLGNGSSESGAKVLYKMMENVRKARTGNPKQGKQIDPHKFMPKG